MQIQKVQSNQPNFGTRVQVDSRLIKLWQKDAKHLKEFNGFMRALENNGKDDVMQLRHVSSWDGVSGVQANVFENRKGKSYVGEERIYDAISWYGLGGKTECVALDKIYGECIKKMKEISDTVLAALMLK